MSSITRISFALTALAAISALPAAADSLVAGGPEPTYADLADLTDSTPLVIRAQPRKLVAVEPERARNVRAGWGRFYVEARTEALIAGTGSLGQQLRYLVDLRLDPKGKPPKIKKKSMVLFARPVVGRPGELQLVAPDAQIAWSPALDTRLRAIIAEFFADDAPQRITGVREAIFVPGNLAGESETQLFLSTGNGEPTSLTISRRPGQPPRWGVSFSELVAAEGAVPQRETLAWYRLACFLPAQLPASTALTGSSAERSASARDYRFVIDQLGSCPRTRN